MFRRRPPKTFTGDHVKPSFVLAAHVLGAHRSEFENFEDYLVQNGFEVGSLAFPLTSEEETTVVRTRARGNLLESEIRHRSQNVFLRSLAQIFSPNCRIRGDVWVGFNSVALLAGGIFKRRRLRVLWSIDYVPKRNSTIETVAYRIIEKVSIWRADVLIDNNPFAADRRNKRKNGSPLFARPTHISPISADLSLFKPEQEAAGDFRIGFLGALNNRTGANRLLPIFELIASDFPDARLEIIGGGPLLDDMRAAARSSRYSNNISILGFVEDELLVAKHTNRWIIGLAPFLDDEDSWTQFADPQKLKIYLASGVIPVMSGVPLVSRQLKEKLLAVVLESAASDEAYADQIKTLLAEPMRVQAIQDRIRSHRPSLDRQILYSDVLNFINRTFGT